MSDSFGSLIDPCIRPKPHPTRLGYRVRTLDRVRNQPFHTTAGTYYQDVMLTVIISGKGRYHKGKEVQEVQTGMVGLIEGRIGVDPGVLTADPNDPYHHIHCRFTGFDAVALARRIEMERPRHAFAHESQWREVADVLERGLAIGRVTDLGLPRDHLIRQDACLMEALVLLSKTTLQEPVGLTVESLKAYLQDHIAMPAALDPMAEHFGISKSYLCRLACDMLGMPLHQYWIRMKIQWAKALLRQPRVSITEVAKHVGFSDPFHFSKTFKKVTGLPPRQWRQETSVTDT